LTLVLGAAKTEDRVENESQQGEPDPKPRAFAEIFGYIDAENEREDFSSVRKFVQNSLTRFLLNR
jgi:hypothetical protein